MTDATFDFCKTFKALTGFAPFPWQRRLFARLVNEGPSTWPAACDIPTGLGKTSVLVVWLLALAETGGRLPRRCVYVVNRRTIVDQVTRVIERVNDLLRESEDKHVDKLRRQLNELAGRAADDRKPLAVSTLRGELADNQAWQDPTRAAVIVATPDLAGSALLFRGYRASWKQRAFYAGLLGHDVLVLHDEAHLTGPFQKLLERVADLQHAHDEDEPRNLKVLALSATGDVEGERFALDDEDRGHEIVHQRLHAKKTLRLHEVDAKNRADELAARAMAFADQPVKVLVYVQKPRDAAAVHKKLAGALQDKAGDRVKLLTGTIRGRERDLLDKTTVLRRLQGWEPATDEDPLPPLEQAEYLVSTSAGEVGADFDADHMVCDLVPADALVQRLGRVNRKGVRDDTQVHVYATPTPPKALAEATDATGDLLGELGAEDEGGIDAGPLAVREWVNDATRSPRPGVAYLDDAQVSALTMTSIRDPWSAVPDVPTLIHGIEEETAPQTTLLWREEVAHLQHPGDTEADAQTLEDIYGTHRPLAHEQLTTGTDAVATFLRDRMKERARIHEKAKTTDVGLKDRRPMWAVLRSPTGQYGWLRIDEDSDKNKLAELLAHATLILPTTLGGLDTSGMLDAKVEPGVRPPLDVADERPEPARRRVMIELDDDDVLQVRDLGGRTIGAADGIAAAREIARRGMRIEKEIVVARDAESDDPVRWLLLLRPPRKGQGKGGAVLLSDHTEHVRANAERFAAPLLPKLTELFARAGTWHDRGKARRPWQRAIGNESDELWGKSGNAKGFNYRLVPGYRHEFGSARDLLLEGLPADVDGDLLLHLILTHHGYGRPCFEPAALIDPEHGADLPDELRPIAVARRFHDLQVEYGPWRLAWLESIFRAADVIASRDEEEAKK